MHRDTHNNSHDPGGDAADSRLDALLASRPITPRATFADEILRAINATATDATAPAATDAGNAAAAPTADSADAVIDASLARHPLRTRPERTERIYAAVLHAAGVRKILRFSVPALAASLAFLLALPALWQHPAAADATEDLLAQAVARDPALAAMLSEQDTAPAAPFDIDMEAAAIVAGLNENSLAWLETLTLVPDEND